MKNLGCVVMTVLSFGIIVSAHANTKALRISQVSTDVLNQAMAGTLDEDMTIEFRQGDQIPFTVKVEGDLVESSNPAQTMIAVKHQFFLRYPKGGTNVLLSWDGSTFQPITDLIKGSMEAGASGSGTNTSGVANAIAFAYKWFIK